jgi:hypothetical protein
MLDQGPWQKPLHYRLGGLVAACVAFVITHYFPTYFVRITPLIFILVCGLIGNAIHESIQLLFDSLPFKLFELWVLKVLRIISKERYEELVGKIVEKRIVN